MLTGIFPFFMCQNPCIRIPHWRPKAAMSMLKPTLLNPYFFRKVIRKPNPTNIITWTSWKSERKTCLRRDGEEWLWRVKSKGQRQLEGRKVPNSSHAFDPSFPHHDQSTSWKLNGCKMPHLIIDYINSCIIMESHWNSRLANLLVCVWYCVLFVKLPGTLSQLHVLTEKLCSPSSKGGQSQCVLTKSKIVHGTCLGEVWVSKCKGMLGIPKNYCPRHWSFYMDKRKINS